MYFFDCDMAFSFTKHIEACLIFLSCDAPRWSLISQKTNQLPFTAAKKSSLDVAVTLVLVALDDLSAKITKNGTGGFPCWKTLTHGVS